MANIKNIEQVIMIGHDEEGNEVLLNFKDINNCMVVNQKFDSFGGKVMILNSMQKSTGLHFRARIYTHLWECMQEKQKNLPQKQRKLHSMIRTTA